MKLSLVTVSTAPAVIAGVVLTLYLTGTTLNIQSFIGSIMAIGVAMANAILLVTFAESRRRDGAASADAAVEGAGSRLRAILMTSCAMVAGMAPMALALGEAGQQNAPLGRAVIGHAVHPAERLCPGARPRAGQVAVARSRRSRQRVLCAGRLILWSAAIYRRFSWRLENAPPRK
jgi:hypothetical protein